MRLRRLPPTSGSKVGGSSGPSLSASLARRRRTAEQAGCRAVRVLKRSNRLQDLRCGVGKEGRSRCYSTAGGVVSDAGSATEEDAPKSGTSTVYVCGATGRTGQRVVRELVDAGLSVKAGVRSEAKFKETFRSIVQDQEKSERLSYELLSLEDETTLNQGVSGADVVVCCLGAPEDEFNFDNPRRIDGDGVISLVDQAAKCRSVKHFVLVTSLGTGRFGWPASVLNLFFGVLYHKRRAEEHLINSGLNYTIVRPGGMERPTDDYYRENKMVIREEDTQFGGQVSRTQVSWCVKDCVLNPSCCENKVLEVVTKKREEGEEGKEYDRSVVKEIDKIKTLGNPTVEGSPAWYSAQYAYQPTKGDVFMKTMAFQGSAPEVINGRLAMLAVVALLGEEFVNGDSLALQTSQLYEYLFVALLAGLVTSASVVPLTKGVEVSHANLGIFKAGAEKLNGRLAMLAFAYFSYRESPLSGDDRALAVDVVRSAFKAVKESISLLDFHSVLSAAGLALLLGVTTVLATAAPFNFMAGKQEDE